MRRETNKIRILDTTCRDGMHAMAHQFKPEQVAALAEGVEAAGVDIFEVSHGDGLGGSSINYGYGAASDREWITAAAAKLKNTKLSILMLPGIGTLEDLEMAAECGVKVCRITTHCTEADIAAQHIKLCKNLGMETFGLLMMVHMVEPEKLLEQAKLMESYGADGIYLMDSSGHLLPDGVKKRVRPLLDQLSIPLGFHAHANLGLEIANTIAAIEEGVSMVDGTLRGLGAGAGNTPIEVLTAVLKLYGYETNINLYKIMDVAEDVLAPMLTKKPVKDKAAITIGYAGVYGSFALHAIRAAKRYHVNIVDILMECGRRKLVGGQEDMINEIAVQLAGQRETKQVG
jgi:4-hydroxy-2-oxovalerate aldolase